MVPMPPPKLLYLVTEDWFFISHRLPMARAAMAAGFEVHVATRVGKHAAAIRGEGFQLHPLDWKRGTRSPWGLVAEVLRVRALLRAIQPDLVHHIAVKPVVMGMIAALGLSLPCINSLVGLGSSFIGPGIVSSAKRALMSRLFAFLFSDPLVSIIVQNKDDRDYLQGLMIPRATLDLIPGSGVYTDLLQPGPESVGPVTFGFVGRLLHDKGLKTLIDAHLLLQARGMALKTLIAGTPDPDNVSSFTDQELALYANIEGLVFHGHVNDIPNLWKNCHVAVLPSRREGLPKSLLEAAACGRPLLASDVPGCREIVLHGDNGLLFEVDNPAALADAMEVMIADPALRLKMGLCGRQMVEDRFSSRSIGQATVAVYQRALARKA